MPNQLKRRIEAFHELLRRQGIKSFTYVEVNDTFDVVADPGVDLMMIAAIIEEEDISAATIH